MLSEAKAPGPHCKEVVPKFGEGNGTPLQYSCLENPMDGGAWKAAVHGVAEGRTRLSNFPFTFHFHALEYPRDREAWWTAVYGGRTDSDMSEVT